MKSHILFGSGILFILLTACSTDDENLPPQEPSPQPSNVTVEFGEDITLFENSSSLEVKLEFSKPAIKDGQIQLAITIPEGLNFYTTPSATNKIISISVEKNASFASFNITPDDDNIIKGMKEIAFQLYSVSEGFSMGVKKDLAVELIDDELYGKPKSFETITGNWKVKNSYTYTPEGRIHKIEWSKETPNLLTGTETYSYWYGKIARINYSENHDEYFYWDGDIIRSSEIIQNGIKTSFSEYNYNEEGNIGSKHVYHQDPNGGYKESFVYSYLYFPDGNLRLQITFIPDNSIDGYAVISQRYHDNYIDKPNWFPVNEIVPTLIAQKNLPGSYRILENGTDLSYSFTYQFDTEGKAVKRETSGETTTYTYY
ncbi:hypothetical protein [Gramella sp. KN1008]|uniref:hypothetical protein n=1 Tax=Gramella sp. KN1008 TaxID=2529298 RepID=UPI0010395CAA|nr:hypothetical protein [Gramella sp. KN1008]TBW28534.1 hypothetical protein EZJ28_07290 [Gramella sp. KN1008]